MSEQIRHLDFQIDPMHIPAIAIAYARQRELVTAYADSYSPDCGDSPREYITRASYDVFPASMRGRERDCACAHHRADRREFKSLLRDEIKRLEGRR